MASSQRRARRARSRSPKPRQAPSRGIHVAFEALEQRLKQLEDAFNTNTKVFSDGIQMLEAQNAVLRRVNQDLLDGVVVKDGEGKIAYNHYLKTYIEELAASESKTLLETNREQKGLIARPDEDKPIIFGGNGAP